MTAKKAAKTAKHTTKTKKHAASAKHTETKAQAAHLHALHEAHLAHLAHLKATGQKVVTKAKPAAHAKAKKKVAFAVGDWLPVCGFEAVAQSLRVLGQRVRDDEVAGLWELCGSAEATSVEDALAAAARFGLAGCRPVFAEYLERVQARTDACAGGASRDRLEGVGQQGVAPLAGTVVAADETRTPSHQLAAWPGPLADRTLTVAAGAKSHALILSIDVPGPHAVLATRDGWWSWGELHDPWPCNVLEAWAVSWS